MTCFSIALTVAGLSLFAPTANLCGQNRAPGPVRTRAEETLEWWNHIGGKLIAMAKDFPEGRKVRFQSTER